MFDSHCHLNFKAFNDDATAIANAMARNRVWGLVVGCDATSSRYAISLAQTEPNLWASVGLHPTHVLDTPWNEPEMKELALEDRVVAIGEVGLDFYRFPEATDRQKYIDAQYKTFQAAIDLAKDLKKPLVLHCRNAYDEVLEIFTKNFDNYNNDLPLRGTIHCFMGTWAQAQEFLKLGFMIGFTGVITYKDADKDMLEAATNVPLDRLLIETDAPYLTPEPYRTEGKKNSGKVPRNLPQYSLEVAKKLGELHDKKMMEIVTLTEENAKRLFRLSYE